MHTFSGTGTIQQGCNAKFLALQIKAIYSICDAHDSVRL